MPRQKVGEKIRAYRRRAGYSQFDLEIELDAAAGSLSRIENGFVNPTTRIRKGDPLDLSGLGLAPSIFQEIVEKEFDLRVTVIGRKVFACAINRRNGTEDLDYRTGITNDQLDYQIHSLPEDVSTMCLQMLDFLGLQFGAFDFIFNKSGEYIFIELNPNGQWGWIEEATNLPMAKAMADLLERC